VSAGEAAYRRRRSLLLIAASAIVVVGGAFLILRAVASGSPRERTYARTAIAVLPFANLSADSAHAYFAGGLHDELLTQLSKVAALSLRGRTSVMGYAGTTKPIRQIAEELQVGTLVLSTVQVVGRRLRVNVQLVAAATDEHLWADTYDRTLDDAFAIQSDVAQRVVAALGAALGGAERVAISDAPSANAEAYRFYLQGREYLRRPGYQKRNLENAQQLFERALALDPAFALAYASLAEAHGEMHWYRYDTSPERVTRLREAAEAALRLAPALPQAHQAIAQWHLWGRRNLPDALAEFEVAQRGLPNDPWLAFMIGHANRRLGNWDKVFEAFERAAELDPRDVQILYDLGANSYQATKQYPEALRIYDRALSLAPDLHIAAVWKGWAYVRGMGQVDTLREILRRLPWDAELNLFGSTAAYRAELLLWTRAPERLIALLDSVPALVLDGIAIFYPKSLYLGWANRLRGDKAAARAAFESADVLLDSVLAELPNDWRVHAARGHVFAGLGRRREALSEARSLERSVVYREGDFYRTWLAGERARILAQAGAADAALDEIERLLAGPSWLTVHTLRLDPLWDPIREHPRFRALVARYEVGGAR
jgi:serine/threonine-protein kinase